MRCCGNIFGVFDSSPVHLYSDRKLFPRRDSHRSRLIFYINVSKFPTNLLPCMSLIRREYIKVIKEDSVDPFQPTTKAQTGQTPRLVARYWDTFTVKVVFVYIKTRRPKAMIKEKHLKSSGLIIKRVFAEFKRVSHCALSLKVSVMEFSEAEIEFNFNISLIKSGTSCVI